MSYIPILVIGSEGKMGQMICRAIEKNPDFKLVDRCTRQDNLERILNNTLATVAIDFTTPDAVFNHTDLIITKGLHPVIGTTGLKKEHFHILEEKSKAKKLGGIIAPNFSMSAILMMQFAKQAYTYFEKAEIIEMHHPNKKDMPSGTALSTVEKMQKKDAAASIPIHALRLPGILAKQDVWLGNVGETLCIQHTISQREAFIPGIFLACKKVFSLSTLLYGLENILDLP